MPFLYFAAKPDDLNPHMAYVKFGNTSNCAKRFKTYGPACRFAIVRYKCKTSGSMHLDDYINQKVLNKNSCYPLVDFWNNNESNRKTDWFNVHMDIANRTLFYIEEVKSLYADKDFTSFLRRILGIILSTPDDDNNIDKVQDIDKKLSLLTIRADNFFQKNFKRGGMMPIKDMMRHPEWETKYIGQVDLEDVNMCRSCKKRAYSGCCTEYSASNRNKVRTALGWH